jgi:hypothetical protein
MSLITGSGNPSAITYISFPGIWPTAFNKVTSFISKDGLRSQQAIRVPYCVDKPLKFNNQFLLWRIHKVM